MGFTEENTPLSAPHQQQPPHTPQYPQQQQQPPYAPQQLPYVPQQYGYATFQQPPYNAAYAPMPAYVPVPYPSPYGFAPGAYQAPPFVPALPILQRHRVDHVGTQSSFYGGLFLGLLFPVFSLCALCCNKTLKFRHGLSVGHALYYAFAAICFGIVAVSYGSGFGGECANVSTNSCIIDVTSGVDTDYWHSYVRDCNRTAYVSDSGQSYSCALSQHKVDDHFGPQTGDCATCVCHFFTQTCSIMSMAYTFFWISFALDCLIFLICLRASRYYKNLIRQQSLSVYQL